MHYVIIHHFIKEGITEEMMQPHVEYLKGLFDRGKLVLTGPFLDEKRGGMFVLDVVDEAEMNEIVKNDPAILNGSSRPEIRPYRIVFRK